MQGRFFQTGAASTWLLLPLACIGVLFILLVTLGVVYWEGRTPIPPAADAAENAAVVLRAGSAPHELPPELQKDYDQSCRVCHNAPGTGAPGAGDAAAWQPRLEQGLGKLLEHTISGHQGMPPMGLCMHCSREAFIAYIQYMAQFRGGEDCP